MIVRTPTRAEGGLTAEEKVLLKQHADKWIERVMRTEPIDPAKIVPAIERLYAAAGFKPPRVVVAPSPFVANLAGGMAASIWYLRKHGKVPRQSAATYAATDDATRDATRDATYAATDDATYAATRDATDAATDAATRDATRDATYAATYAATRDATYDATDDATYAATRDATERDWLLRLAEKLTPNAVQFSLGVIKLTWNLRQGGNHWGAWDAYLTACRDVLGLTGLPCWDKYAAWEECAIEGSWRVMHEEFCIVSDFPEILRKDEENRPHSEIGASHRWRDGWELYHLDGIRLEKEQWQMIVSRAMLFKDIMAIENADIRALALKYNPDAMLKAGAKLLDKSKRGNELFLIEGTELNTFLDHGQIYMLRMPCPTGRTFVEGVDPEFAKVNPNADVCQAHALGITPNQYRNLTVEG